MVLKLNKGGINKPAEAPAQQQPAAQQHAPAPQAQQAPAAAKPSGLGFLKKGKAAAEAFAKEEHKAEQASKNNVFRFWLPKDKEGSITFLDGNLNTDGLLDVPFYYEHNINMNGKWGNFFICTQDEEPCPICEGGTPPSYVCLMTVIDHSEYVSKKDGQVKKDNVKLLVCKRDSVKMLQKLAVKRGGLRGCRFDVSRTGDKSPSIGNVFDFTEKLTEQQLVAAYKGKEFDKSMPINYEKMLGEMYMNAKDLRKLGFGSTSGPIGGEAPMSGGEDFVDQM